MRHGVVGVVCVLLAGVLLAGCDKAPGIGGAEQAPAEPASEIGVGTPPEADPLARLRLPREFRLEQEDLLEQARADLEANPDDPDALIWVGRRLGYLGRFEEAIEVYTEGTDLYPVDPRFYRHRGHRFISVRQIDAAVADLEKAASLILGTEDAIELDGLPNEFGIPTSTHHSNIWYHLGLAYYLRGDFERARAAYQRCLAVSDNPDMLSATLYWLYLTLARLDLDEAATEALAPVAADMKILENRDYLRLLLMFKGEVDAETLLEEEVREHDGLGSATAGYGVGTWYLLNGDEDMAREIYGEVVAGDSVTAFGFIAAENELRRP